MFSARRFYTLILWLALPYVFFHLLWRARKQPEYLAHIGERFGFYSLRSDKPVIWLHTVSVGETRAAVTLVQRLRASYPEHQILLTHTTPTGRATSEQLFGDDVMRVYLPYDYPFAVRRFLNHFRPKVGVLLETEIWFNLVHGCHRRQIPLLLLNARLSDRSARGYARWRRLTRTGLHELFLVAAQTEDDAMRLASLGNRAVPVMGNLKFDIEPPAQQLELGQRLRTRFGHQRPVFLAASTREGEEELLLDALSRATTPDLLTILVPRHPQRFDAVAQMLEQRQLRYQRRSADTDIAADTQIVLGDSMGEMFAYYAACDLAFIGGSLLPLGGQNLIEASAVGKPVLIGPHTFNFTQATQHAIQFGAALRIADAGELVAQLDALLQDKERQLGMAAAALRFVSNNRGATDSALSQIAYALNQTRYNELIASPVES